MVDEIPDPTIRTLARSIYKEATSYGFLQLDFVKLINHLMDLCMSGDEMQDDSAPKWKAIAAASTEVLDELPVKGERIGIRAFQADHDTELLERWLPDKYGRYFVLSCAAAQLTTVEALTSNPNNHVGIITLHDGTPIGAMAMLDHSKTQRRAELRKLIGEPDYRGQGIAEEATRLWIQYGIQGLGLEKIYVSTLQTQVANIRLNESIGFQVEGLLRDEVLIDGRRCDLLRMGLTTKDS